MREPIHLRTNAKVNLFLRVRSTRSDGYHDVETVLQSVALADDVSLLATTTDRVEVDMVWDEGLSGDVPPVARNLAYRAARRLVHEGAQAEGARIEITKRVPIGAGLGGGSANAAGVLLGLNEAWGLGLDDAGLRALAADVGSDVPFCVRGGTALGTGRGERLTEVVNRCELWFALGMSSESLSTARVYSMWDEIDRRSEIDPRPMIDALGSGDVAVVASLLHNDLEPAAFAARPELRGKKDMLLEAGALGACVSGSGPTLLAIAPDADGAAGIAAKVDDAFDRVAVAGSASLGVERREAWH